MSKKLQISLFVVSFLCLGFFREYLFVGINGILYNKYSNVTGEDANIVKPGLLFFTAFSYNTLYTIKWFNTLLFAVIFWWTQKNFLRLIFNEKKTNQWLGVLYLSLLLLAGISFVGGWLIGHLNEGYRFSRIFMGLAESPAPCMILIPLTYFYKNYNTE